MKGQGRITLIPQTKNAFKNPFLDSESSSELENGMKKWYQESSIPSVGINQYCPGFDTKSKKSDASLQ